MKKVYLLCFVSCFHIMLFGQVQSINLQALHSCNGATLVPFVIWSGTPRPVTVNYERLGSAGTWFTVVSQVYDANSYIVVSPTDISSATNYRIRAVDMTTLQEYFSNGVTVDPALWNADRGAANVVVNSYWGAACDNSQNYAQVSINYLAHGRPPFRVEYKTGSDPNFLFAGEAVNLFNIMGIQPGAIYSIRVTDYCGNASPIINTQLGFGVSVQVAQDATTCDNGKVMIFGTGDSRSGAIPPYEFGIGKFVPGLGGNNPPVEFGPSNTFDNLPPGEYTFRLRDACGNLSSTGFARLGGGFPRITASPSSPAGDPCSKNITVNIINGDGPFEYGIRYIQDPYTQWSWQTSNLFTGLTRNGVYFVRIKDKCGQLSDSTGVNVGTFPVPRVDNITHSNDPTCNQSITVNASSGNPPYEYGLNPWDNFSNVTWQTSNVFTNLPPNRYQLRVKDNCGRVSSIINDTIFPKELTLHIMANTDSCNSQTGYLSVDSVTNGIAPILYAVRNMASPGNTYTPFQTDSVFQSLPHGIYSVWVKDGCFAEKIVDSIFVGSPFTYEYNISPNPLGCSPFLVINLHNALNPPFTYLVTNGTHKRTLVTADSTFMLTDLPDGTYRIIVTNACGDTAATTTADLVITGSTAPQITYELQYVNNCTQADIIVHGAPAGSIYQLWSTSGFFREQNSPIFSGIANNITGGKYAVVTINFNICDGNFYYEDTVFVATEGQNLTGTVNTGLPDSFCIYHFDPVKLADYLDNEVPGGEWNAITFDGFDAINGTFNPSQSQPGTYEFTYSMLNGCGFLEETSIFLTVASEACQIRAIVGDYHSSVYPSGCKEIPAGFSFVDFTDNHGNLIFSINPLGNDLSTICAGVRIVNGEGNSLRSTIIDGKTTFFLDRNFYINPANPFGNGPMQVILYITGQEMENMLNYLHSHGYPQATIGDIRIYQKHGDDADLDVVNEGATDPARLFPITPVYYQNGRDENWMVQFEVYNFSEFTLYFTGNSANLPLQLIDFTGVNNQGRNRLQWKTAQETNTSHFNLERSNDGNNFTPIARVNASGNSNTERLYTYDDKQPLDGDNFYRLKMVDLDGQFTISKTILVRAIKTPGLKLSPNPVNDRLYVTIPGNIKARSIRIFDAAGRMLYQQIVNGTQPVSVPTSQLRNGWYLLELQTTDGSLRQAFLKQ
jgi:hypothetical protein